MSNVDDRLIAALRDDLTQVDSVRHVNAVDRAVTSFLRKKAGLESWDAMDALTAMREAWERRSAEAQKAA